MSVALLRIRRVFDVLREELEADVSLQAASALLAVALEEGISTQQVAQRTGVSVSAASRNIGVLGEHGRGGRGPFGLVSAVEDPADRRFRQVRLTPKGRRLVEKLHEAAR